MKKLLDILIVEDEALIADHLAEELEKIGYNVVGIVDNALDAYEILKNNCVEFVLLDINLIGDLSGIDIAHYLNKNYKIPFVYLTSNTDPKTIEKVKYTNPYGFIVKPFQVRDLKPTIDIASFNWSNKKNEVKPSFISESAKDHIFIKEKHQLIKINYADILYLEALDNYCKIFTDKGKFVLSKTLKSVYEKLPQNIFFKSHRSYIVNYNYIDLILPKSVTVKDKEIPLSETGRKLLLEKIEAL